MCMTPPLLTRSYRSPYLNLYTYLGFGDVFHFQFILQAASEWIDINKLENVDSASVGDLAS